MKIPPDSVWDHERQRRNRKLERAASVLAVAEHLDLYESGVAEQVGFSFSAPQVARQARFADVAGRSVDELRLAGGVSSWRCRHARIV